jgi:hypothetical protein
MIKQHDGHLTGEGACGSLACGGRKVGSWCVRGWSDAMFVMSEQIRPVTIERRVRKQKRFAEAGNERSN